ncbi:MAG: type II toxin-antitoxin system RatA family toxin [Pseudomonadota bacterium]
MKVSRSALLPHSAMQMYEIVADVEQYPKFLNWCEQAEVLARDEDEIVARLKISYGKLKVGFTTRNQNVQGESIQLNLVEGPFSNFQGNWYFQPLGESACKVSIEMKFDFDRSLTPTIFAKVFEKIMNMQLDAFQKRARQLHGGS